MENIISLKCPIFDKQVDVSGKQPGQIVKCHDCEYTCKIVSTVLSWRIISTSGKTTQTPTRYELVKQK